MQTQKFWLLAVSLSLILALLLACAPRVSPTPAPMPTPVEPKPSPVVEPSPTSKPIPAATPVTFAGKTVTIVAPLTPGGAVDIMARLYSRYLPPFVPGNPAMIVRNMPGGESIIGANYGYSSKPDGLTLLLGSSVVYMADLLDKPALRFSSLTEMTALISAPPTSEVYAFPPGLFDRPEDIVKAKGIIYGHTTGPAVILFVVIKEFVGIPVDKVITAYIGAAEARRAFLAGETTGVSETSIGWATAFRSYYEKGQIKILCQTGAIDENGNIVRHPQFPPDIITAKELYEKIHGKPPSGMAYEAYKSLLASVKFPEKPLLLPPGSPNEIRRAYWAATEAMTRDPEFLKVAEPLTGPGKWIAGETLDKMFKKEFGIKPEVRDWLKDLLKTKYGMVLE